MALIKCPECGKEVSDKALACIHCGYPLELMKKNLENSNPTVQEKTFVERLRYENSDDKRKKEIEKHTNNFINMISRGIFELIEDANRDGKTHISGYLHFGGYDPGDCIPSLSEKEISVGSCRDKDFYYNTTFVEKIINERLKNAGFTDYKVSIIKDKLYEYETKLTWTGKFVSKKVRELDGENYRAWIDIKW